MALGSFKTHNQDGTPKTCKFCGEHVWWESNRGRWYNPGGLALHVATCPKSAKHYSEKAKSDTERGQLTLWDDECEGMCGGV